MNMHQFRAFVAVVDQGSIRAAARYLHLSQSAITKAVQGLEEETGAALLIRRSRGVELTEAGQLLVTRARLITRQAELAREELRQAGGDDSGTLRVGINPFISLTSLGGAFHWFRQRFQRVHVEFSDGLIVRVLPRLRDGTLDLAVVAADAGELQSEEFHVQRLRRIPQMVVVRSGHPLLASPNAQGLVEHEWIFTRPLDEERSKRLAAMFARAGVQAPKRHLVCDALQAFSLQRRTDAVSLMPQPLLGNPETRDIVPIKGTGLEPFDLELAILSRGDVPLTPAAEYFAHCVVETIASGLAAASA
ncbi:LysR substrate-binding domain-containing protein [Variovorax sp. YR216]|uniref:LysR substrate-binding domain-containing protein n=1 Tax=Variovorax sp. YR216 TaxID=1882828 RepID=UPI0008993B9A|nr:LysR substrate-binding domain-containing protein [Variovorax sp. YR216]SEB25588.1 transcriptional regulator, LysR family [Variovorax sp. YR216]